MIKVDIPEKPGLIVHVEGVDGSGKSTYAKRLSELRDLELINTRGPTESAVDCVQRICERLKPNSVSDRSSGLISELVYGPVLRGHTVMDENTLWYIVAQIIPVVVFVYCRPPPDVARDGLTFRPEETDEEFNQSIRDKHEKLYRRYDEVFERIANMGGNVMLYDWTAGPEVKPMLSAKARAALEELN